MGWPLNRGQLQLIAATSITECGSAVSPAAGNGVSAVVVPYAMLCR